MPAVPDSEKRVRTIAVFTGNRADYGLLHPLIAAMMRRDDLRGDLKTWLVVGGDHLRTGTVAEIEADGFPVAGYLSYEEAASHSSTEAAWPIVATADILPQARRLLEDLAPDALLVLGDRYETFAVCLAAFYARIPIAHVGGGDITEGGCPDDVLRFMISDLSDWHFTISQDSAERLIRRGIPAERVYAVGSPVIDNLAAVTPLPRAQLCARFGLDPERPIVLFTQHPIPAEGPATADYFAQSIEALGALSQTHGVQALATRPNRDAFGPQFDAVIASARERWSDIRWADSLGRLDYLSWLSACDVVLGNSSSGLIETPYFKKPSVTVGPRQRGRLRAGNVVATGYGVEAVRAAVLTALTDEVFRRGLADLKNPFGDRPVGPLIADVLASEPIGQAVSG